MLKDVLFSLFSSSLMFLSGLIVMSLEQRLQVGLEYCLSNALISACGIVFSLVFLSLPQ